MRGTPGHIDVDAVRDSILSTTGVVGVCDLHIWTISSGLESLSAHVVVEPGQSHRVVLKKIRDTLHDRFGIGHMTIQLEPEDFEEQEGLF